MNSNPRQLIICCDGTNNTLTANDHDTNVLKTFELLASSGNPQQILYYDPGVGAPDALPSTGLGEWFRNKRSRLWGLASGRGIYENISQAYLFLMTHYRPGDQIFLFGFSRGAFTVRCLSGMVHLFGIIDPHHQAMLPTLLRVYFSAKEKTSFFKVTNGISNFFKSMLGIEAPQEINNRDEVAAQIRKNFGSNKRKLAEVHFIGVWDTVSSVGLPGFSVSMSSNPNILNKRIQHVRHALALDEHRAQFKPRVYEQNDFGDAAQKQSLRQRWFRGNHCDIGGGYAEQSEAALSDRAWRWMIDEAKQCDLQLAALPETKPQKIRVHDETHSMPWWALLVLSHRRTSGLKAIDHAEEPSTALISHPETDLANPRFPEQSVWAKTRNMKSLLAAMGGCVFFGLVYGACLEDSTPTLRLDFQHLWQQVQNAWQESIAMSESQLLAVAYPQALAQFGNAAHPYIALFVADLGLIASYGFLLARFLSWSFAHRLAFMPMGLDDKFANFCGRLLPLLIAADLLENLTTALAFNSDSRALMLLLSLLSAAKFLLLGTTVLACIGLRFLKR